eukprot:3612155-Pyramimonas_sp.AAC.1
MWRQLAINRQPTCGGNFDKSANVDLGSPRVQQAVEQHLHARFVTIVAPATHLQERMLAFVFGCPS